MLFDLDATSFECPEPTQVGVSGEILDVVCPSVLEAVVAARRPSPSP